jgi:hypothetical protein
MKIRFFLYYFGMTQDEIQSLKAAAEERVRFLLWLCDRLSDENAWRARGLLQRDLIKEVRQLLGELQ